jgi:hypothetical protein
VSATLWPRSLHLAAALAALAAPSYVEQRLGLEPKRDDSADLFGGNRAERRAAARAARRASKRSRR